MNQRHLLLRLLADRKGTVNGVVAEVACRRCAQRAREEHQELRGRSLRVVHRFNPFGEHIESVVLCDVPVRLAWLKATWSAPG